MSSPRPKASAELALDPHFDRDTMTSMLPIVFHSLVKRCARVGFSSLGGLETGAAKRASRHPTQLATSIISFRRQRTLGGLAKGASCKAYLWQTAHVPLPLPSSV